MKNWSKTHYINDGSVQANDADYNASNETQEAFELTDEMRKNIAVNPYNANVAE
ncbi:hypothetical protein JOC75_001763 [Metabacillus crassostreae]|uniref:hypothetical protein n=1 Tax=Metabacillus crassostreae TaxID=929098 RepID=UPI001959150F|nr:hypothetical protein [Metabacillus crassostreae]MBM7603790.1 hypothetical protein [Metabacillus crassostreae]